MLWYCVGLGDTCTHYRPTLVTALKSVKVKAISAGGQHCCCVTKQGVVFVWGNNTNGQCGVSPRHAATLPLPQVLKELPSNYVGVASACGFAHTLVLMAARSCSSRDTDITRVYSMGLNSSGQVS